MSQPAKLGLPGIFVQLPGGTGPAELAAELSSERGEKQGGWKKRGFAGR